MQVYFSRQFEVHVIVKFFDTCLDAFMLSSTMAFMWWRRNGRVKYFFSNSCGTLIWVRIIPVKVDRSLTGIIRTYILIFVETEIEKKRPEKTLILYIKMNQKIDETKAM